MTVIGRRSAVPGNDAGARLGDLAGVSPVLRAGIALRRRLRGPAARRSFRGRLRPAPRRSRARGTRLRIVRGSIAFSHWATFIVVAAHGSILMTVPGRPRVQAGSAGRPLWADSTRSHAAREWLLFAPSRCPRRLASWLHHLVERYGQIRARACPSH